MELAFDNKMNSVINDVLDKLKLDTITTTNTDTLHTTIDELKHKESDKRSSNYRVLNEMLLLFFFLVKYFYIFISGTYNNEYGENHTVAVVEGEDEVVIGSFTPRFIFR